MTFLLVLKRLTAMVSHGTVMLCDPGFWERPWRFLWADGEAERFRTLLSPGMKRLASASKGTSSRYESVFCGLDIFFAIDPPLVVSSWSNICFVWEAWITADSPFQRGGDFRLTNFSPGSSVCTFSVLRRPERVMVVLRILWLSMRSRN